MASRTARTLALVVFVLASTLLPGLARAKGKEDLEKAERAYANLAYDEANKLAIGVTKQHGLTHDQLVRAWRLVAVTHAILDHEDPARDAFIMVLTYDADFQADPNLGPKVTTPFFEARGFWRGQSTRPGIDVQPAVKTPKGGSIHVTVRDPSHIVKQAELGWRWGAEGEFKKAPVKAGDESTVDVPAAPPGVTRLDYYVQAIDDKDNVALESGNASTPKTITVEAPPPPPVAGGEKKKEGKSIVASPVFWGVLAGAAVLGGSAALFFATRPGEEAGNVSLTPTLNCAGQRCN